MPEPAPEPASGVPRHLLRGEPEAAPDPAEPEVRDLSRRGSAGPYPVDRESERPRTAGGLPRRVRTGRRDTPAAGSGGPGGGTPDASTGTPAGAVPFAPFEPFGEAAPAAPEPAGDPSGDPSGDDAPRDPFVPLTKPDVPGETPEEVPDEAPSADAGPVESDATRPPLPRRVRQASLAPQLRTDTRASDLELDLNDADPSDERTPEQAQSMMASIQQGWLRGRAAEPDPGPAQAGEPAEEEDI